MIMKNILEITNLEAIVGWLNHWKQLQFQIGNIFTTANQKRVKVILLVPDHSLKVVMRVNQDSVQTCLIVIITRWEIVGTFPKMIQTNSIKLDLRFAVLTFPRKTT